MGAKYDGSVTEGRCAGGLGIVEGFNGALSRVGGNLRVFLTVSQDLKVNLCGLQQDNVVTVMVRIIMWELLGDSHAVAIQWVHMVKDPLATILLVHTVTSKYTFCYQ